jgi:hypothetical protein
MSHKHTHNESSQLTFKHSSMIESACPKKINLDLLETDSAVQEPTVVDFDLAAHTIIQPNFIAPLAKLETTLSANLTDTDLDQIAKALAWVQSFERQICLELIRNAPVGKELEALNRRLETKFIEPKESFWGYQELAQSCLARATSNSSCLNEIDSTPVQNEVVDLLKSNTSFYINLLQNIGREAFLESVSLTANPNVLFHETNGEHIEHNTSTTHWAMWYPGLNNDHLTLAELLDSLPGLSAQDIPDEISELEDPASPLSLPGAVSLARHDVLHAILGRGLMDQDEVFVIGFTMGNASEYNDADGDTIKAAFANRYPEPFRVYGEKLQAFDLGVTAGRTIGVRDIANLPIETMKDKTLGELRRMLKISTAELRSFYHQEKELIPSTFESGRLPN